jgi:serine-type D-Ala-D-Ala carboxypeptidase (penicillin-binding protein 5/6)
MVRTKIMLRRLFPLLLLWMSVAAPAPVYAQSVQVSAPIAFLVDVGSGTVLYGKGEDTAHPPSALIKLLTAETVFTALGNGQITTEQEVLITEAIWRKGGAPSRTPTMFAAVRSSVQVNDLLKGMLTTSANDGALALASAVSGSEENFVVAMRERSRLIGLKQTRITNPTGFADPGQTTTARDLGNLGVHIVKAHADKMSYFTVPEITWSGIRMLNRNPLLSSGIGVDGFVTGSSGDGDFGLVTTAQREDRRLVAVIMGAATAIARAKDARTLLDWGFTNFQKRTLLVESTPLSDLRVSGGVQKSIPVGLGGNLDMLVPISRQDNLQVRILHKSPILAPVAKNAEVGRLQVLISGSVAAERPLIALVGVEQARLSSRAYDTLWEWLFGRFQRSTARG